MPEIGKQLLISSQTMVEPTDPMRIKIPDHQSDRFKSRSPIAFPGIVLAKIRKLVNYLVLMGRLPAGPP